MAICRTNRLLFITAAVAITVPITAANAGRTIQIDEGKNTNTLSDCHDFSGCKSLELGKIGTSVFQVQISPTGFVELVDGYDGGPNRFYVAQTDTVHQVLSGFTLSPSLGRIDFVNFFSVGRSMEPDAFGRRPDPNFQIQFRNAMSERLFGTDLEISFAYRDSFSAKGDHVPGGARIGYSGTLGVRSTKHGDLAGFEAERFVTNTGGLLLGTQAEDSDFVFVVGDFLRNDFETTTSNEFSKTGLVSETFLPRYGAVAPVPEPATWMMLLLGFGAVGASLRRRQNGVTVTV